LLFQIVFQARIRAESGAFELADVIDGIADKLVRRHPHVFGDEDAADAKAVRRRWDELKKAEGKGGVARVPRHFPALLRAEKVGKEAAKEGFDWPDVAGPLAKVDEELAELRAAMAEAGPGREERVAAELGDLLFAVVNAARHLGVNPELALERTTDRFAARYAHLGAALGAAGRTVRDADPAELDGLWEAAKAALAGAVDG
ncbi:MAG: MazG family protein, partial [Myxococcales bacterium]|nr:MazG family protein [Myxococcales bacterium]